MTVSMAVKLAALGAFLAIVIAVGVFR